MRGWTTGFMSHAVDAYSFAFDNEWNIYFK